MSKVITFSRFFPAYHPKAGQPTFFEERVCRSIWDNKLIVDIDGVFFPDIMKRFAINVAAGYPPKHHTIRAGKRFKQGDRFSPRVWSGKPYNSKQIQFAPDIQVKKVWDFEIENGVGWGIGEDDSAFIDMNKLALNDGLSIEDLRSWFNKPFEGQIICWNENINY